MKPPVKISKPSGRFQRGGLPNQSPSGQSNVPNTRLPSRPATTVNTKAPNYAVQPPLRIGVRGQQIRATIGGTQQIAGSIDIATVSKGKAYISNLQVDQQHRRRGIGAKLIDAALNTARRQGFSAASLEARSSENGISPHALVAMYRRQGFKSIGKSHRGSPIMERKL